jgi:PAS domain S-box-containing protein
MTKAKLIEQLKALQRPIRRNSAPSRPQPTLTADEMQRLVQELQIQKIELEMQNWELYEAQQQLKTSRDYYADLYDFAPVGDVSMDEHGVIGEINLAGAVLLGMERSRLLGQPFTRYLAQDDRQIFLGHLRQCRQTEGTLSMEVSLIGKGGISIPAQLSSIAAQDVESHTLVYRSTITDITERKQLENKLRREQAELEERVRQRTRELYESTAELQSEVEKRKKTEKKLQQLLRRIVQTQEDERRHISLELHDHVGQQLTALRLSIEIFLREGKVPLGGFIGDLQGRIRQLDATVDFLARELRPAPLDDLGLVSAIANFVEEWSKQSDVAAEFHTIGLDDQRLSSEAETNLYRIAQEGLNNISKHANAGRVEVILETRGSHIVLTIKDDGIGFDVREEAALDVPDRGLGLVGMRERAMLVGGTLEIESSPGEGTTVFACVPFSTHWQKPGY